MKITLKEKITNYLNSFSDELRLKLEYRKNKPHTPKLNKLGKFALVFFTVIYLLVGCLGAIKSSAAEVSTFDTLHIVHEGSSSNSSAPSDLRGYTVTVPTGWTATSSYGNYDVQGIFTDSVYGENPFTAFYVGYALNFDTFRTEPSNNSVVYLGYAATFPNGDSLSFTVSSGADSSNPSLIQWLANNNATFVNNNVPEEPEPTTLTVPAGIYYLQNIYNDLRGTIEFDKPFTTSNGEEFVSIEFAGYNNNQYTLVSYYTNPVTDAGPSPSVPKPIYNGLNGFTDISDCIIYLEEDTVIEYYDELWDDTFVSVNSDTKLINLYNGVFKIGDAEGYDRGYTVGDADGYQEGYDDGRAHGMEDGFMSNFFGGIVDALDALTLFGSISMLDIIEGILGLMLCLWILKLIAGG